MTEPLVLGFDRVGRGDVARVGGKGANLGEMTRAGFPVPPGFCVTTAAYRLFVAGVPGAREAIAASAQLVPGDLQGARIAAASLRAQLSAVAMPQPIVAALAASVEPFDRHAFFAIRSSATAEDLAEASFAGQQDTYLNVSGIAAICDAVRSCFASLFSERAILYRAQQGFANRAVELAVVVQRMLHPEVSGILFTADPITGHRHMATISASFGLGEAVVSGLVSADFYRVDRRSEAIAHVGIGEKTLAIYPRPEGGTVKITLDDKRRTARALGDEQVRAVARLGSQVAAHAGEPQDIEWCIAGGSLYLLQARPITSLFPLPAPPPEDPYLRVHLSFNHLQVMTDPLSPMARSLWRLVFPFGRRPRSLYTSLFRSAGGRLYLDVTPLITRPLLRRLVLRAFQGVDPLIGRALAELARRPELRGARRRLRIPLRSLARFAAPAAARAFLSLAIRNPARTRDQITAIFATKEAQAKSALETSPPGAARIRTAIAVLGSLLTQVARSALPRLLAAILSRYLVRRILVHRAAAKDLAYLDRGVTGNVTTEMDLAVGDLADSVRGHPAICAALLAGKRDITTLADLPGGSQVVAAIAEFLDRYGMRGPSEIDLARPKWRDDPESILQVITGNLRGEAGAHRRHQQRLVVEAEQAMSRLIAACGRGPGGAVRRLLVRRLIRVHRTLIPLREHPKFVLIRIVDRVRDAVLASGAALAAAGRLSPPADVFFLELPELADALENPSWPVAEVIAQRRQEQAAFLRMTPPRVLSSDGESPVVHHDAAGLPDGALAGAPVSAGVIEGTARVVLDPTRETLYAGEILVAPFTDPGWTPLFVNAAGLVMEVGGLMTHGSVVAREYGIPAVVGVVGATTRIQSGDRVRVHGDAGYVEILHQAPRAKEAAG